MTNATTQAGGGNGSAGCQSPRKTAGRSDHRPTGGTLTRAGFQWAAAIVLSQALLPFPARAHDPAWFVTLIGSQVQQNAVQITAADGFRTIESNGLPDHPTGQFPNRNNPNRISPQRVRYRMTLTPQPGDQPTAIGMNPFGIALNGIVFDPSAAEFWQRNPRSGWQYDAMSGGVNLGLDDSHAHVQPDGSYHYHGLPTRLIQRLMKPRSMVLVGYAADGFPIYAMLGHEDPADTTTPLKKLKPSYQLRKGSRSGGPGGRYDGTFVEDWEYVADSGDLDECNGRFGITPEYPAGIYHYCLTDAFPFIPRQWKGAPDESFQRRGPPGGRRGPGRPGFGPPGFRPPPPGGRPPRRRP